VNLAETSRLLTFVARCDNRRVDDATVTAWQSIIGDVPFGDGMEAARRHFATSTDYLMPVHIRRLSAEIDQERRRAIRVAKELAAAADEAANVSDRKGDVMALLAELRDTLPPGDPDKLRRAEWVEWERNQDRAAKAAAEPNPHFTGFPLPDGA
jgi:hypothetical protein